MVQDRFPDETSGVDPDAALSIMSNDLQRIVRALAVYLQTSVPFSKSRRKGMLLQAWSSEQ
jgi:tRNA A37 N6-isopentenylltransferase MiaA